MTSQSKDRSHLSALREPRLQTLAKDLGNGFVSLAGRVDGLWDRVIHQDVATILLAEKYMKDSRHPVRFHFHQWSEIQGRVSKGTLAAHIDSLAPARVLVFIAYVGGEWAQVGLNSFYDAMDSIMTSQPSVRVYPSRAEFTAMNRKLPDINALDEIAQRSRQSDPRWTFRPLTCPGTGKCALQPGQGEDEMVVKRGTSDGARHVRFEPISRRERSEYQLGCYLQKEGARPRTKKNRIADEPEAQWFHQQKIQSLQDLGEYRVFLCGSDVIVTAFSQIIWEDGDVKFMMRDAGRDDFSWYSDCPSEQAQKQSELKAFARYIRDRLLALSTSEPIFESLMIGVRLDIGISEESRNGKFFVSEITRWWNGNHMPMSVLPCPHTQLSYAYGTALAKWICASTWDWKRADDNGQSMKLEDNDYEVSRSAS